MSHVPCVCLTEHWRSFIHPAANKQVSLLERIQQERLREGPTLAL